MQPTTEQTAIYTSIKDGESISANAVAGSGKSTTMKEAITYSPHPFGVILVFNKANAESLNAKKLRPNYEAKTLNGLGHKIWADQLGRRLTVNANKSKDLLNEFLQKDNTKLSPDDFMAVIKLVSIAKAMAISPGTHNKPEPDFNQWENAAAERDIESDQFLDLSPIATQVLKASTNLAWNGYIDFDDQLYMPVMFDARFPKIPFVGVDEAQDLSTLQHEMVARLKFQQLMVVGDPHQAIYAFRGASSSSFHELTERFNLTPKTLSVSFRCPHVIGKEVRPYASHFQCFETNRQGTLRVLDRDDPTPDSGTYIARYNAPLITQAFTFIRRGIPVNYLGRDFLAGIRALNKKYPTLHELEQWLKKKLNESKTDGAKDRAKDQYSSLATLYEAARIQATTVDKLLEQMMFSAKLGNAITLATVHKFKGMEDKQVTFLGGAGHLDSLDQPGQEANINYVALTRAIDTMILTERKRRS